MRQFRTVSSPSSVRRAPGFSLIELMVAITIGLFVSIALGAIFLNAKSTFLAQDGLASLHDNERLAMSLLTTEVQLAGYFPDPAVNTSTTDLPADATAQSYGQFAAGQGVAGVSVGSGSSDIFAVRFSSASGDGLMNCQGGTNSTGANLVMTSIFSISANNELQCSVNGAAPVSLVSNVRMLSVLYATDTSGSGNVDKYLTASAVTAAALWQNVKLLQITLTFVSPFTANQVGASIPPITWVQNIGVMGTL